MSRSSPNMAAASALHSSVFPTPVGPTKIKEPMGRLGSLSPARARRIAFATAETASSWPMTRLCSSSSRWRRRALSSSVSLTTGIPVQPATIRATSSEPMVAWHSPRFFSHSARSLLDLLLDALDLVEYLLRAHEIVAADRLRLFRRQALDLVFLLLDVRGAVIAVQAGAARRLVDQVDRLVRGGSGR